MDRRKPMGDINFNISKFLDFNKIVTLEIDKDVDVNENNSDKLAEAESDAEAFGPFAMGEVNAYTFLVTPANDTNPIDEIGLINALGNTVKFDLTESVSDPDLPAGVEVAQTIEIIFTNDSTPSSDLDNVKGFGALKFLSFPPPPTPDLPIPTPLCSIYSTPDKGITRNSVTLKYIKGSANVVGNMVEAIYSLEGGDLVINFGSRTADLDGDGVAITAELTLTVPKGSLFTLEYMGLGEIPKETNPDKAIELEFNSFVNKNNAFFTHGSEGEFDVISFELMAKSIQAPGLPIIGDYGLEVEGLFFQPGPPNGRQAFTYAQYTAAVDLMPYSQLVQNRFMN